MRIPLLFTVLALGGNAAALEIGVVGVFPGKAVLVIDGAPPKTYDAGARLGDNARLVAVEREGAQIEVNGRSRLYRIGDNVRSSGIAAAGGDSGHSGKVVLSSDSNGHFFATGQINGSTVRMLLDTGATLIALPARDAERMGINYRSGKVSYFNTANGTVQVFRVMLDTVRVGELELHQVEASVHERGLDGALLGMSFLNRTRMQRDGSQITLEKRF